MVAIIDYGLGNLASVQKALNYLGVKNSITNDQKTIRESDFILLPGVGSFAHGMSNLREKNLFELLNEEVIVKKKNFIGICLGMQLVAETGTEPELNPGLGWVKGMVKKIETETLRIPHMGWNNIAVSNDKYMNGLNGKDFYFIHSYHFVPEDKNVIAATVDYGQPLVAAIQTENIFATQFHPEKSQQAGLELLRNYFKAC